MLALLWSGFYWPGGLDCWLVFLIIENICYGPSFLTGWGAISSGEFTPPDSLMEREMTIVSRKDCFDFWLLVRISGLLICLPPDKHF